MPATCGPMPPSDAIGVGDGPRYVSKNDDVGGGISGGNWCGPARTTQCFFLRKDEQLYTLFCFISTMEANDHG
jgi:hypothetical protein